MIRLFLFLILILALGWGFAWIADRPGEVSLDWQGRVYETGLMVVVIALVGLIAAIMISWSLIRSVLQSPALMSRFFKNRRRDRGYKALSQGLIAASAGDSAAARRLAKESGKLLTNEPLVELLDAQTSVLEGKGDQARQKLEAMLNDDKTKLVALRGLYLEAQKQGEGEAARHYAEKAHEHSRSLPWAANAMLRFHSLDQDWHGALAALESNRAAGLIDKISAKRQRAVLLTALAQSQESADPDAAVKSAREAHKLAPDLVPAAIIGAKAMMRNNDLGKAASMLAAVWKKQPHPELAEAYIGLRIGDAAQDRLKRAQKLATMRAHHPEGNMAIAETAIEAGEWQIARDAIKPVLTNHLSERACLIMADIEEGEFGDKGKMRDWLSRAVRAPKNAIWTADGYVSENWLPISPVTGQIDAFEYKVPVAQLGSTSTLTLEADEIEAATKPDMASVEGAKIEEASATDETAAIKANQMSKTSETLNAASAAAVAEAVSSKGADDILSGKENETLNGADAPDKAEMKATRKQSDTDKITSPSKPLTQTLTQSAGKNEDAGTKLREENPIDPSHQRPDDPGPRKAEPKNEEEERKKILGLF